MRPIRAHPFDFGALVVAQASQGRPDGGAHRHAAQRDSRLRCGVERQRLERRPQRGDALPASGVGSPTSGATASGKLAASPDTAPVAPRANACGISASGPTKMSNPSSR